MKSLSLTKPHLIVTVGVPGAGKSFFASQFASTFNAPLVSYDYIRAAVSDAQPSYSREESHTVGKLAKNQLDQLVATRATIVVDGGSDTRVSRREIAKYARSKNYEALFVWVQTDGATAMQRATVGSRTRSGSKQPILLSVSQYDALSRRFTPPNDSESFTVISGKHTYATQAKVILKKLSKPRADKSNAASLPANRPANPGRQVLIR